MPNPTGEISTIQPGDVPNLDTLIVQVRASLLAERAAGPPQLSSIEAEIAQAQTQVDKAQIAASQGKAQAKQLKREIDEWKLWYHSLPEDDKPASLPLLESEINWRASELNALTSQISQLLSNQAIAEGNLELAEQRLIAFKLGVYNRPIEEDPRLTSLIAARDKFQGGQS